MKGIPGVPTNMQGLLKQAQKIQKEIQRAQENAQNAVFEASSGGGMVKAKVSGKKRLEELWIAKEVVQTGDVEVLQDMIVAAVNEGLAKAEDHMKDEVSKVTGGLPIPGM